METVMLLELTEAMRPLAVIPLTAFVLLVAGIVAYQVHRQRADRGQI